MSVVRYPCFDCGVPTGSPLQVWRRTDGKPIDWASNWAGAVLNTGIIQTLVHRGGQGCHRGQTTDQVRTGGLDVLGRFE